MSLLYFILVSFGLTQIVVYGKIFDKLRPKEGKLGELFSCPMCVGFHVGWILWLLSGYTTLFSYDESLVTAFGLACLSSGTSYILNMLFGDCGFKIDLGGKHETNNKNKMDDSSGRQLL